MDWQGKTILITGASRGIGRALAKRFGLLGANVVLAAKTVHRHPSLPGSLQESAALVEESGGKALAVMMDVRDEGSVEAGVAAAVGHFGGIDVCIHNAGAFWLEPSMQTGLKRHDLLFGVNVRGALVVTQQCYPHLQASAKRGHQPHVLNISPPIDVRGIWFEHTNSYSVSKYAMSLQALGWAREFARDGIAVNCLWPRTGIESPAALFHGGEDLRKELRKACIMVDAAVAIVESPVSFTGQCWIDDTLLYSRGVRDFDAYSVVPGNALVPDYFVPKDDVPPPGVRLSRFRLYELGAEHPPLAQ